MTKLPKDLQSALWSYDVSKLDDKKDASLIITQLLNYGGEEAKDWVWKNYSESEIARIINHPQRGTWNRNILREILTKNILGIKKWTILFSVL